jgi:hypothetical protein
VLRNTCSWVLGQAITVSSLLRWVLRRNALSQHGVEKLLGPNKKRGGSSSLLRWVLRCSEGSGYRNTSWVLGLGVEVLSLLRWVLRCLEGSASSARNKVLVLCWEVGLDCCILRCALEPHTHTHAGPSKLPPHPAPHPATKHTYMHARTHTHTHTCRSSESASLKILTASKTIS